MTAPLNLPIEALAPHPDNPRLEPNEEIIGRLTNLITAGGFDEAHAVIVRPLENGTFQIISGHHRMLAAGRAGLTEVPCWVREMSDQAAFMALALENIQSELHPLEEGRHAIKSGMSVTDYARAVSKSQQVMHLRVCAARVMDAFTTHVVSDAPDAGETQRRITELLPSLRTHWRGLAEIHAAPEWPWAALAGELIDQEWTVEKTRNAVGRVADAVPPPEWADADAIAVALVRGDPDIGYQRFEEMIAEADVTDEDLRAEMMEALTAARPGTLSAVLEVCDGYAKKQRDRREAARQSEIAARKAAEASARKAARLRENVSLEDWEALDANTRATLLATEHDGGGFGRQANDGIEWARWSWDPVTGCAHSCSYCYARDLATSARMRKAYPQGFAPALRPRAIRAPRHQKLPKEAAKDIRCRNVITCSMADLFGPWVPAEWVEAVLAEVAAAPQWNFLVLTKFPQRMAEFRIPTNSWMGTTVDLQARVADAEAAFAKIECAVRWLSVEPMLEPLKFERLDLFDWIVIGGASKSNRTPEWQPPFQWIVDLVVQARAAGTRVYFKGNLGIANRILEAPAGLHIKEDPQQAPKVFSYLCATQREDKIGVSAADRGGR